MKRAIFISGGLLLALGGCASADKSMPSSTTAVRTPVARTIATGFWQDMRIQVEEAAPTSLYVSGGTEIMPSRRTSFDLKVLLTDRHEGTAIAYSRVSATITRGGRTVSRAEEEPTLTSSGVPDYENDVSLPAPGIYKLVLTIGSPAASRHLEYSPSKVWRLGQTHRMVSMFSWK